MSLYFFRSGIKPFRFLLMLISLITMAVTVASAAEYHNNKSLAKYLKSLTEQSPDLVRVDSIAQSTTKRKVWLVG